MSSAVLAAIIIPIVALVALAIWIVAVLHADKHPHYRHPGQLPPRQISGGSFQAVGGRQVMPRPGAEPSEPSPSGYESAMGKGAYGQR